MREMRERERDSETVRVRVSECGRKIRNANRMPKSDDRTESNLRRGRREGGREGGRKTRRRRGEGRWGGERGEGRRGEGRREGRRGGVFDLKNQGLGFAPGRKKPCYRKSNSS